MQIVGSELARDSEARIACKQASYTITRQQDCLQAHEYPRICTNGRMQEFVAIGVHSWSTWTAEGRLKGENYRLIFGVGRICCRQNQGVMTTIEWPDQDLAVAEIQGLYGPFTFTERLLQKIWLRGEFDVAHAVTEDSRSVRI